MGRKKIKDRAVITLNLPVQIVEALRETKNASDVASDILIEHCEQIGMLTLENKRNLIRGQVEEFIREQGEAMMREALRMAYEEFTTEED